MARRRHAVALLHIALLLGFLPAAAVAGAGELRFDRISVEQGLSHVSVWSIYQDSQGFLWFGTLDGLNRFDGYEFKVYRHHPADPRSLAPGDVVEIGEDGGGDLWVGTYGGGLDRFRRADESFIHYRHDPADPRSLSSDVVLVILEDRQGRLWFGTAAGLDRLDRGDSFTRFTDAGSDTAGRRILSLIEDQDGRFWIGTPAGLRSFDPRTGAFTRYAFPGIDAAPVRAVRQDEAGRLWIAAQSSLIRFDSSDESWERVEYAPPGALTPGDIRSLAIDHEGTVWIGHQPGGLFRLDPESGESTRYRNDPWEPASLSDNTITALFEDRTGILWVATLAGINRLDRSRSGFRVYRQRPEHPTSLSSSRIWAVLEDRANELWIGTFDGGLNRLDAERTRAVAYRNDPGRPSSLPHDTVSALYEDRAGELWVGTLGGLCRWQRQAERCGDVDEILNGPSIRSLHEDRDGRFWVGSGIGLYRLDRPSGRAGRFTDENLAPGVPIQSIAESPAGDLWIAVRDTGVVRLAKDLGSSRIYRFDASDPTSLSSNAPTFATVDSGGTVWIGTFRDGLNRLDPSSGEIRRYRHQDGLSGDGVFGLLEDGEGRLWLATNRGLCRFDPATTSFRTYDTGDGLASNVFAYGSAYRGGDGRLYFGGSRGLHAFRPEDIVEDPHPPAVVFTDFQLFNKSVGPRAIDPGSPLETAITVADEIHLSHRDYVFAIEFAALHYASPPSHRYLYRLEHFNDDWIATDASDRVAHYSNLDPGSYVFRVRASNDDDVWTESGAALRIVVSPAPWRSRTAYALYVVILAGALALYLRSHRLKIERERTVNEQLRQAHRAKDELLERHERLIGELAAKNDELTRFTYTVSHDLKSPLITIRGFIGMILRDIGAGRSDRLEKDLGRIHAGAESMQQLLDDLLELSRIGRQMNPSEGVAFGGLVEEVLERVAGRIAERGVEVVVEPDLPELYGDRLRLLEVVQNLVENAVKFMGDQASPRIEIGASAEGDAVVGFVRDNGIGIDPKFHEKVFGLFDRLDPSSEGTGIGLALVHRIVDVHGGRVWVESEGAGRGSTFYFRLPSAG